SRRSVLCLSSTLPSSVLTAPAGTEIYTLSLHDALPIWRRQRERRRRRRCRDIGGLRRHHGRGEERERREQRKRGRSVQNPHRFRSEERRVGKECRVRWSAENEIERHIVNSAMPELETQE